MLLALSKFISPLLFPTGLTVLLCLAAALLAWRRGSRAAAALAFTAAALLYIASSTWFSYALLRPLESRYPPPVEYPAAAAIVLLGGSIAPPAPPRVHTETGPAGDRLLHAGRLWRRGLAPVVVTTGGYLPYVVESENSEAALAAGLLHELFDVPREAIHTVDESRTTHEDATRSVALFDSLGLARDILLVTSASHMPRAVAVFRKAGFRVTPAPTDFQGLTEERFKPLWLLPRGQPLAETTVALHEYLGLLSYRLTGRL